MRLRTCIQGIIILLLLVNISISANTDILAPKDYLGHEVGADYQLARWETIVSYFQQIGEQSDRVLVEEIGKSTENNPFIMATISSPETFDDLALYKQYQRWLSHPNEMPADQRDTVLDQAKTVVLVNCAIHSNEIGSSQMAIELLYDLATADDKTTHEILENTIILLIPSANPDGIDIVIDWYEDSLGTPWEGQGRPWLYQKYADHDNNRDWFMITQQETRIVNQVLYHEWYPAILYDVHQMGNSGMRFFVPPFYDPVNPNIDPLIAESLKMIGGHMSTALAAEGKKGVGSNAVFDMWWHGGTRSAPYRHNIIGILTEAASPRIASPIFQQLSDLRGQGRGMSSYQKLINFVDPWPGGWWRLRDVVDYELIACNALFKLAAKYRDQFNENYLKMGEKAIRLGNEEPPYAFVFPLDQHDMPTMYRLLNVLLTGGVDVHIAEKSFEADGIAYPAGTPIIFCAQPYRAHVLDMLQPQEYPDRPQYPGGPPEPPYDVAGWTLSYQMGVDVAPVLREFTVDAKQVPGKMPELKGEISGSGNVFVSDNTSTNDFILLNRAWKHEIDTYIVNRDWKSDEMAFPVDLFVKGRLVLWAPNDDKARMIEQWGSELGINLEKVEKPFSSSKQFPRAFKKLVKPRIGLYQPYTRNMDEGWTRFVLEQFEFDYRTVHNDWMRAGRLDERLDVLIIPDMGTYELLNGQAEQETAPHYTGGIGEEGVMHLQEFVEAGGVLLCLDSSTQFAIEHFNLPVKNVLAGLNRNEFFCPGSVLRIKINQSNPLGYGMPSRTGAFFARSFAYEIELESLEDYAFDLPIGTSETVAVYDKTLTLLSGWIQGREHIQNKSALVNVSYGEGNLLLYGFRVQHRAQSHGTFRLLFNGLVHLHGE